MTPALLSGETPSPSLLQRSRNAGPTGKDAASPDRAAHRVSLNLFVQARFGKHTPGLAKRPGRRLFQHGGVRPGEHSSFLRLFRKHSRPRTVPEPPPLLACTAPSDFAGNRPGVLSDAQQG